MNRFKANETSQRYEQPYRPMGIRAVNALGRVTSRLKLSGRPLTVDALVAAARRKTGLREFGDNGFVEPLIVLLESIENEARLTPMGRFITRTRLTNILANRLRVEELVSRHPEILDEQIEAPIVITGLQRTGTTMLHRLLAADPGMRALASWEALMPAPLLNRDSSKRDPRIRLAERAERGLAYLAPDFFAVHPVEAEAPEEEVLLLDHAFLSTVAEATLRVPSYARWLEKQDQRPAYDYLKLLLQVLQWQRRGERWVLKTPHHLEWLDVLLQVFPDARLVWMHRSPVETMASYCSMIAHGRGVFTDDVDAHESSRHWFAKTNRLIDRALSVRGQVGESRFCDVRYTDLVAGPLEQVARVYAFAGRPLSKEVKRAMTASKRSNPQHKYGRHRYQLEDFGLTTDEVRSAFEDYASRFALS